MRPFELVFVVFDLLLGLALSEVLAGFSRVLKASRGPHPVRIGWLVPLLGLVVVLDFPEDCPDVDAWYLRQRRLVLCGLLGANVASWVGPIVLALTHATPEPDATTSDWVSEVISTATGLAIKPVLIALLLVR